MLQYRPATARVTLKGSVPEGVVFAELTQAAAEHAELIEQYLGKLFPMEQNLLTAAQAAHLNGGVLLYVPRGVVVEEPLEVIYEAQDGEAQYLHTLVIAEDNAQVTLLERYEGAGDYLSVHVVEVFPLQGARVRYGYLQNHSQDAWAFTFRRGLTGRDATLDWVGGEFGGGLVRSEIVNDVAGEGAESNLKVVFGATGRQHQDIVASQVHNGSYSRSDILGRGVLSGRAHTVFRGNGQINPAAKHASRPISGSRRWCFRTRPGPTRSRPSSSTSTRSRAPATPPRWASWTRSSCSTSCPAASPGRRPCGCWSWPSCRRVLEQIPVQELRDEMIRLMGEKVS